MPVILTYVVIVLTVLGNVAHTLLTDPNASTILTPTLKAIVVAVASVVAILLPSIQSVLKKGGAAGLSTFLLVLAIPISALLLVACKDPAVVTNVDNGILTAEQEACVILDVVASPSQAAVDCGIVQAAGDVTTAIFNEISKLLEAGKLARDPAFKARVASAKRGHS